MDAFMKLVGIFILISAIISGKIFGLIVVMILVVGFCRMVDKVAPPKRRKETATETEK